MDKILPPPDVSGTRAPRRIQRSRAKGWRLPAGAVVVSRPSKWGNPFVVAPGPVIAPIRARIWDVRLGGDLLVRWDTANLARADATDRLRRYLDERRRYPERWRAPGKALGYPWDHELRRDLAGKDLVCWCPLDAPCHADVLLELANAAAGPA